MKDWLPCPAIYTCQSKQSVPCGQREIREELNLPDLLHREVPTGLPSLGGDVTVYVLDINQPSWPTLCILFSCLFLSLWPFQLYFIPWILPTTLHFLILFFWSYFCPIGPFNYIQNTQEIKRTLFNSVSDFPFNCIYVSMKVSFTPDIILCGWLGLKL